MQESATPARQVHASLFLGRDEYFSIADGQGYSSYDAPAHAASIDVTLAMVNSRPMLVSYAFRRDSLHEPVPSNAAVCHFKKRSDIDGYNFPTSQGISYFLAKSMVDSVGVNDTEPQAVEIKRYDVIVFRTQDGRKGYIKVDQPIGFSADITIWTE